jgi:predicted alpha-1,6-mannanase (GH76 family)
MNKNNSIAGNLTLLILMTGFSLFASNKKYVKNADQTLQSIYKLYGVENNLLLRETYPFNAQNKVTYLADSDQASTPNLYAYLWPYSGSLTATVCMYDATNNNKYRAMLDKKVIPGLELYCDSSRRPIAYASYIKTATADRFYDDNIWLGIDFTDMYMLSKNKKYLAKALVIWDFILSGNNNVLDGGIFWCEQKKESKHACSNAPASVYALKLFEATNDSAFFYKGLELYNWTIKHLQDTTDYLIYDNINRNGNIDKAKYSYNSGQMINAAALLFKLTGQMEYLQNAQKIAKSAYNRFFTDNKNVGEPDKILKKGDVWFTGVLLRGFIELYEIDKNNTYLKIFKQNLDYAWLHMRTKDGLFNSDWTGKTTDNSNWLLTQFAMVEMYARMSQIKIN